jgi:hypothetical protein
VSPRPDHTRDYGSASYLVTNPEHDLIEMWVEVAFCRRCGAIVHDIAKHDDFHAHAGVRAAFGAI